MDGKYIFSINFTYEISASDDFKFTTLFIRASVFPVFALSVLNYKVIMKGNRKMEDVQVVYIV